MDLARVREMAVEFTSVGGSQWGRTLGVGALRQRMRSVEGVRAGVERSETCRG
jgi:hypothetical protein